MPNARSFAGLALACLTLVACAETTSSTVIVPQTVERPGMSTFRWISTANGRDILDVYPLDALNRDISGRVDLECIFSARGTLSDCRVLAETPPQAGFGPAALRIMDKFRYSTATYPEMVGTRARQTIRFMPG